MGNIYIIETKENIRILNKEDVNLLCGAMRTASNQNLKFCYEMQSTKGNIMLITPHAKDVDKRIRDRAIILSVGNSYD